MAWHVLSCATRSDDMDSLAVEETVSQKPGVNLMIKGTEILNNING